MALCGGCSPSGSAVFSGLSHAQVTAEVLGAADVQAMGEPGWARHTGTYVGCMFTDYGAPATHLQQRSTTVLPILPHKED